MADYPTSPKLPSVPENEWRKIEITDISDRNLHSILTQMVRAGSADAEFLYAHTEAVRTMFEIIEASLTKASQERAKDSKEMTEDMGVLKAEVRKISMALVGDEMLGATGLVRRVDKVESKVSETLSWQDRHSAVTDGRTGVFEWLTKFWPILAAIIFGLGGYLKGGNNP